MPDSVPPNQPGQRALATIVFTDGVNFSRRMSENEEHTFAIIRRDLDLMRQLCQQFAGQVVKFTGDGLLMYFTSAIKAVTCALEIQKQLAIIREKLPAKDVLEHRIGIHLSDVILNENDVLGHGVNIAARLQTIAAPGGICVSKTTYDIVKNHITLNAAYLGHRSLKNIPETIEVYQLTPPNYPTIHSEEPSQEILPKVFISYRTEEPVLPLAQTFYQALKQAGYPAFLNEENIQSAKEWPQRLELELNQCDYFLTLLSEQSALSEMVIEELHRVKELRELHPEGKPILLPIRIQFPANSPLNYHLQAYLKESPQKEWRSPDDTERIIQEILQLIKTPPKAPDSKTELPIIPEPSTIFVPQAQPLPSAILPKIPELPEGQVDVTSLFYMERPPIESRCYETIVNPGSLIAIKAPRQMGKTSLMARILHYAAQSGCQTVALTFELADSKTFTDLERFLTWFCLCVGKRLNLPNRLADYWDEVFGVKDNCTAYFEEYILEKISTPLVLGLDEVDKIFPYPDIAIDFFGLLRAWHEDAKNRPIWKKLRLVVVHSTEVYIPLSVNQSPFNVGLPIELREFNGQEVYDLTRWHDLDWDLQKVERLMALIGGHPYLTRLALYHLSRGDVTLDNLWEMGATESGIFRDHLRRFLWILEQYPALSSAMKQVVNSAEPVRLDSRQAFKLQSMGLVNLAGNEVTPRCHLYRNYFRDRLGDFA